MRLFTFLLLLLPLGLTAQKNGQDILQKMKDRYAGKFPAAITFTQTNTHYRADTAWQQTVWEEYIEYPDKFRIDRPNKQTLLFVRDSLFDIQAGKLAMSIPYPNNLLLLLGGLHHRSLADVSERLRKAGYDLSKCHKSDWQGRPVWVIGAQPGDTLSNQFWVDAKKYCVVRTIEKARNGTQVEGRYGRHIRMGKAWIETEVMFLRNGLREQYESYQQVQRHDSLPATLFEPKELTGKNGG